MRIALPQLAHAASVVPAGLRFERDAAAPARAQARQLRAALTQVAGSCYGQAHGLSADLSLDGFRRRVPIVDHAALQPWIERVAAGEPAVLTRQPVTHFERTSGSAAASKLIPFTGRLLDQFASATGAWLCDLYRRFPALLGARSYWSVSPAAQRRDRTAGGLAIGIDDDTRYLGPIAGWTQRRLLAVSPATARLGDVDRWRWETARQMLAAGDLGLISVWSPTLLSGLMAFVQKNLEALLAALEPARRRAIERALELRGELVGEAIWPRLALVSCWMDAASARFAAALRRWFPRTPFQPKGLLATEGVVSFPLWGHDGAVLAVGSHFLEFVDLQAPAARPLLAHELRSGGRYSPLLTTAGGLYRYRLGDVVRCVGHYRATPLVRFEGKLDQVSDLCGEKLDAIFVETALAAVRGRSDVGWDFALLAPDLEGEPHYTLFIETAAGEGQLAALGDQLDRRLRQAHHYDVCRRLGQLGPLQVQRVEGGWSRYQERLLEEGAVLGSIKATPLDRRPGWRCWLVGSGDTAAGQRC